MTTKPGFFYSKEMFKVVQVELTDKYTIKHIELCSSMNQRMLETKYEPKFELIIFVTSGKIAIK